MFIIRCSICGGWQDSRKSVSKEKNSDWGGHAYVDWCGSTYTVYLYKYLYKGAKKVKYRLQNADEVNDDEITLYLRVDISVVWMLSGGSWDIR
jgi:hypothetical protein